MGDPSWAVLALLIAAAITSNTICYWAWKNGVVPKYFSEVVLLATVLIVIGADHSVVVLCIGAAVVVGLGLYGAYAVLRYRPPPARHAVRSEEPEPTVKGDV